MYKRFILHFLFLILCLARFQTFSQEIWRKTGPDKPLRVEIPVHSTDETYRLVTCGTTGLILFFKSTETLNDSLTKWYFALYDSELKPKWIKNLPLRTGLEIRDYVVANDTLTLLFLAVKEKGIFYRENVVKLDCRSGKNLLYQLNPAENITPVRFEVLRDQAYFGYNVKNEAAHLQVIRLKTGKAFDYPLSAAGTFSSLTGFVLDTVTGNIYTTLRKQVSKGHYSFFVQKIEQPGTMFSETEISTISPEYELVDLKLVIVNPEDIQVIATYGIASRKTQVRTGTITGSTGLYTCQVKNGVQTGIRFLPFIELSNIQNIIGSKDLLLIKKKSLKKNRSFEVYSPEWNVLLHPVTCRNGQFIVLGESYTPQYHSENFTEFDFYGRPYINTYNVFDGYRYTHAIIAAFDPEGNLQWDNSLEIRNLISPELTSKVNLFFSSSDTIVLVYSSEGRIASKIIRGRDVIEKLDFSLIDQLYPEDKMLSESKNNMNHWYGAYFVCYGYQEIKNINSSGDKKRLVFYFTKVRFE